MKIAVFSSKKWVKDSFSTANSQYGFTIKHFEARLTPDTAPLADGFDAVCVFVNDNVTEEVLSILKDKGVRTVALRCAGYNNVDIKAAAALSIQVVRVPAYSPYAVAEHALGLLLALNRRYYRAYNRIREHNFSLDGLLGFDIHHKTVGIIGTGKIGQIFANLMMGFECRILAYDKFPSDSMKERGVEYVGLQRLFEESDIISLHCPLTHETYHVINDYALSTMKPGVAIINTSRGPLICSRAVIAGLKSGKIGYLGLDVYEEESDLFFEDLSDTVIHDDVFVRLQTFPNVLITAHQAFFTKEAVSNIAETTFSNLKSIDESGQSANEVKPVEKEA